MPLLAGYDHLRATAERLQWDAEAVDLTVDRIRWPHLDRNPRRRLSALLAGFAVAEHHVADELAPFVDAAPEDAVRDLLKRQAADERRHARFFDRALAEVAGITPGPGAAAHAGAEITALFAHELPAMAARLATGTVGLDRAVGLYHLTLEAVVLSVGQDALISEAQVAGLPGICAGVTRVQADERWHVGLGVALLDGSGWEPDAAFAHAATRAVQAWGADVIGAERVDRALRVHARRLRLLAGAQADRTALRTPF